MKNNFIFTSVVRYKYHCNNCNKDLICFEDERLEKEQRPTPFTAICPHCKGTMYDNGFIHIRENVEITEFDKNENNNGAIFLLLDKDLKRYGDMACGCLHIRVNNKLIPTYEIAMGKVKI